jgi:hypothetical protein
MPLMNRRTIMALATCAALALSSTALAAKGGQTRGSAGSGTGSTIELIPLTSVSLGGEVTFKVWTTRTDRPWVRVTCAQDGTVVYQQSHGFYPSYKWGQVFTLGPTNLWTSGGSKCTARLGYWSSSRYRTLTSISFAASG